MIAREVVQRLEAFYAGRPLPRGSSLHFPIVGDDRLLLLAVVRMGGESSPWGIGYRRIGEKPVILTVPDGRQRDDVGEMAATFAVPLLKHLRHPKHGRPIGEHEPLPQLWVPGPTHIDMFHFIAYSYTYTTRGQAELLNTLGRTAGWIFREARRPGQVMFMDASEALRESFVIPAETIRQAHLGFLLAWLTTRGGREARMAAAAAAERQTVGITMDPMYERNDMEPFVEQHQKRPSKKITEKIHDLLAQELVRRLDLVEQAIELLRSDPRRVSRGIDDLVDLAREEYDRQYLRVELQDPASRFVPSPETDFAPAAAANRFLIYQASADKKEAALLHDDAEVQAEVIAAGDGFQGTILDVRDEGNGRSTIPVWTIDSPSDGALRIRVHDKVCVAGVPKRAATVRSITPNAAGGRTFEVEITNWKTRPRDPGFTGVPHAGDGDSLIGSEVTMLKSPSADISITKSLKVWSRREAPGAWLTHTSPRAAKAEHADAAELRGA